MQTPDYMLKLESSDDGPRFHRFNTDSHGLRQGPADREGRLEVDRPHMMAVTVERDGERCRGYIYYPGDWTLEQMSFYPGFKSVEDMAAKLLPSFETSAEVIAELPGRLLPADIPTTEMAVRLTHPDGFYDYHIREISFLDLIGETQ